MKAFNFYSPSTLREAYELMDRYSDYAIVAGGTDIVIELNDRIKAPGHVININKIPELKGILAKDGRVHIGSMTTFDEAEHNEYVKKHVKALYSTAYYMGSPQVRKLATLGGNLCNASVAGDALTTFLTLDADVVLGSSKGTRTVKLLDLYKDPKKTALEKGEIMLEIVFDELKENQACAYAKLGKRKALAIVVLGIGAFLAADKNGVCTDARVVVGAVARYPRRLDEIEQALVGKKLTKELIAEQLPKMTEIIKQMIPTRISVGYKSESVRGITRRALEDAAADLGVK